MRFLSHAAELTPLATEFRDPGDVFEPSAEEAERALRLAEELASWIIREFAKLPPPGPPLP
jgi:hypothetical protein